jgi:hypothetical protein
MKQLLRIAQQYPQWIVPARDAARRSTGRDAAMAVLVDNIGHRV